LFYVNVSRFPS